MRQLRLPRTALGTAAVLGLLAIFAFREILLATGAIGRHWDWVIPYFSPLLENMARLQSVAWTPIALGSYVTFRYGHALPLFVLGLPGYLGISGGFVTKLLLLFATVMAGLGMWRFTRELFERMRASERRPPGSSVSWLPLLAAVLYMLSPFHYSQIIGGDALGILAYALAPHTGTYLLRALRAPGLKPSAGLKAGLSLAFLAACSLQTFVLTVLLIAPLALLLGCLELKPLIGNGAIVVATGLLVSAYWLLPVLFAGQTLTEVDATTLDLGVVRASLSHFQSVVDAVTGTAYWAPFYRESLPSWSRETWSIVVVAVVLLVTAGTLLWGSASQTGPRRRVSIFWTAALLVSVCLSASGSGFGTPVRLLYEHSDSWAFFFRTPQHLVFPFAWTFSVVTALAVYAWTEADPRVSTRRAAAVFSVVVAVVVSIGFLLSSKLSDYIGPFRVTAGERAVQRLLANDPDTAARVISLPGGVSRHFRGSAIRSLPEEAGDDADLIWSLHPALTPEIKWSPYGASRQFQRLVLSRLLADADEARSLLNLAAVKYVVLTPYFSPAAGPDYLSWDRRAVQASLDQASFLQRLYSDGEWTLWENSTYTGRTSLETRIIDGPGLNAAVGAAAAVATGDSDSTPAIVVESDTQSPRIVNISPTQALGNARRIPATLGKLVESNAAVQRFPTEEGQRVVATQTGEGQDLLANFTLGADEVLGRKTPLGQPGTFLSFEHRATTPGPFLAWLQGEEGSFQGLFEAQQVWTRELIPLQTLPPVGNITWRQVVSLRLASAQVVPRNTSLEMRALRFLVPTRDAPYLFQSAGWFVESSIPAAVWNYFDPYRAPVFRTSGAYQGTHTLALAFDVPTSGRYSMAAVVVRGPSLPPLIWSIDGGPEEQVSFESPHVDLDTVQFGEADLQSGPHLLRLRLLCRLESQACGNVLVANFILTPEVEGESSAPVADLTMTASDTYMGRVTSSSGGLLLLRDSFDRRWVGSAKTNSGGEVALRHVPAAGFANGWFVPAGTWRVTLRFEPQQLYTWGIRVSTLVLVVIIVGLLAARLSGGSVGQRRRHRGRPDRKALWGRMLSTRGESAREH